MSDVWGSGQALTPLQMGVRAAAMFVIMILLVRLGGVRMFGKKSSFDVVLTIVLGAVAARGIVGASPFPSTVAGSAVLVFIHRLVGWLTVGSPFLDRLIKGRATCLYEKGQLHVDQLDRTTISMEDLEESLRLETKKASLDEVESARLERNGRISFLTKER